MVDIRSTAAEIRRGKKKERRKKKERNYRAKIYVVSLLHRATIKTVPPYCIPRYLASQRKIIPSL